jgi:hypothetical protein
MNGTSIRILIAFAIVFAAKPAFSEPPTPVDILVNGGFETWLPSASIADKIRREAAKFGIQLAPGDQWPMHWTVTDSPYNDNPVTGTVALDETCAHSGTRSIRLTNQNASDTTAICYQSWTPAGCKDKDAPLVPNRLYRLSWWVKGQDVGPGGNALWLSQAGYSSSIGGGSIDTTDQGYPPRGTFNWRRQQVTFITNAGANGVSFRLALENTKGTVWIDDVKLEDCGPAMAVTTY